MRGYGLNARWGIPFLLMMAATVFRWTPFTESQTALRGTVQTVNREQAARSGSDAEAAPKNGPLKPFTEYYDIGELSAGEDVGNRIAEASWRHNLDIEFLLATVPDPIDSRFGYQFDGMVDTIEEALGAQGWSLDHFWLPWKPSGEQPERQGRLKSTMAYETSSEKKESATRYNERNWLGKLIVQAAGALQKVAESPSTPLQELEPGALVFRQRSTAKEPPRVLIVLLVGETPTSGVHKKALFKSFNIIAQYTYQRNLASRVALALALPFGPAAAAAQSIPYEFRVVGPRFSGSERSLSFVISEWISQKAAKYRLLGGEKWNFRVVTGCAVKIDLRRFTEIAAHGSDRATVGFAATVIPLDQVMASLFSFLAGKNGRRSLGKVALLTESDTEFGKSIDQATIDTWVGRRSDDLKAPTRVTQIKFPFHVSQVALAYDEERTKAGRSAPALVRPSSRLPIPSDETGSPRDTVPALSFQMSTATSEFVLGKILEAISQEDFRYVGIVATDTRDTIFLAGLIHRYCPDVQVFAPEGDLLVAHPSYAAELRGMILASSYPLFSMVQRWDPPYKGDRRRHLFASQENEGTYNAVLTFLLPEAKATDDVRRTSARQKRAERSSAKSLYDEMFDYGPPFGELKYLDLFWNEHAYPFKGKAERVRVWSEDHNWMVPVQGEEGPPIWVSMVGQRGLWPLECVEASPAQPELGRGESAEYLRKVTYDERLFHADFVEQFAALLPQFTWQWGALFLGLAGVCWVLILANCRCICASLVDSKKPDQRGGASGEGRESSGLEKLLVIPALHGDDHWGIPLSRELYATLGIGAMAFALWYALSPCRIVLYDSPWALFSRPEVYSYLPEQGQWNWRFSAFSVCIGWLTLFCLVATALARTSAFLWCNSTAIAAALEGPARDDDHKAMRVGARLLLALLFPLLIYAAVACLCLCVPLVGIWGLWAFARPRVRRIRVISAGIRPLLLLAIAATAIWIPLYGFPQWWCEHVLRELAIEWSNDTATGPVLGLVGTRLLEFERLVMLDNGVSPLVPVLFLAAISVLWLTSQLIRLYYADRLWEEQDPFLNDGRNLLYPNGPARAPIDRIFKYREQIKSLTCDVLTASIKSPMALLRHTVILFATGTMFFVLMRLVQRTVAVADFGERTVWLNIWIWCLVLTVVFSLFRFVLLWKAIQDMLRVFTSLPLLDAYGRVPPALSRTFGRYLGQFRLTRLGGSIPVQKWIEVARGYDSVKPKLVSIMYGETVLQVPSDDWLCFTNIERSIKGMDTTTTAGKTREEIIENNRTQGFLLAEDAARKIQTDFLAECFGNTQSGSDLDLVADSPTFKGLRKAAIAGLHILVPYWRSRSVEQQFGESPDGGSEAATEGSSKTGRRSNLPKRTAVADDHEDRQLVDWMRALEDLFAFRLVVFISQGAVHLRNLGAFLAVAPVLLLLAVSSYPLQPQRFMIVFLWAILLIVVVSGVTVVIQMEHNEFLSRVSRTKPNKIAFDPTFVMNVLAFILPLLVATLAQFPFVSDTILQWIEPITRVLK